MALLVEFIGDKSSEIWGLVMTEKLRSEAKSCLSKAVHMEA